MRALIVALCLLALVPSSVVLSVALVRSLGLATPPPLPVVRWRCAR